MHRLTIRPQIQPELAPLYALAANFAWTYDHEVDELLKALATRLAELGKPPRPGSAPYEWLYALNLDEQRALGKDTALLARVSALNQKIASPPAAGDAWQKIARPGAPCVIAYFSAEFGLHEALPIYAGGLGILAGDHLKSASGLGLPLVGVGLFYQEGYHEQRILSDGAVRESYQSTDPVKLGAKLCTLKDGGRLTVRVQMGSRMVHLQVWQLAVGRVTLLLLDANVEENAAADRAITARLYGGDYHTRIEQELALGVGGVFALEALGIKASVYHMNEGHAAFLSLARLFMARRDAQLSLEEAAELITASNVFTTHTPIAAGNDVFSHDILLPYLAPIAASFDLPLVWLLDHGRENPSDSAPTARFSMTAFALSLSGRRNGVSKEHGAVSRRLWHKLWPGRTFEEIPIGDVVNGVHLPTWTAPSMERHYRATELAPSALWADKHQLRQALVHYVSTLGVRGAGLDPNICTVGFARRFAEYKRALMLFSDPDQLRRLLFDAERPMQLVFAGKAHPNNTVEKANIKRMNELIRSLGVESRVVFIENYNMAIARLLVQGVDVWLNTPRPPLEASGTSGMKVVLNGALNVSVLDGWWKEAYAPELGWAIGDAYERDSPLAADDALRDARDTASLYHTLEHNVLPLFYERDGAGVPRGWVEKCIASGRELAPRFSSDRMVEAYAHEYYWPAFSETEALQQDNLAKTRARAEAYAAVTRGFQAVTAQITGPLPATSALGERLRVRAVIRSPELSADLLRVDLIVGAVAPDGGAGAERAVGPERAVGLERAANPAAMPASPYDLGSPKVLPMSVQKGDEPGEWHATCDVEWQHVGAVALCVRVLPALESQRLCPRVLIA